MNIKSFFKGTLQIVAFATFISVAATSCADDSMTTTAKGESSKTEFAGLAKSTLQVSLGGGIQLDPATRSLDSDGAETRSVLIKRNGTKYTPIVDGDQMEARIFIAKETEKKVVGGKEVFEPAKDIIGAGKVTFQAKQLPDGRISLYYPENTIDFAWAGLKSFVPKPGENWYICGIIGGEYKQEYDATRRNRKLSVDERYWADLKYNFYVDFDPNSSPKHNQMDENGNVQVVAPYTTGWVKLDDIERAGVINQRALKFKPIGTLLHFRVKRDQNLVPAEACRYAFASSQISANGGFLMMPQSNFHQGNELQQDYDMGVNCEVRPWENSIENNFCWDHKGDRQLHMNNTSTDITTEENDATWGDRIYEYRYTFDASSGKNLRDGYDDFYVWGMPITYKDSNGQPVIGQTMLTAERGGYMLGRKQEPKDGQKPKYPYADEWLYSSGTPALASGEYRVLDFKAADKKNKAYSVEVGVCRPRYSDTKYPWANPLERIAVTNMTEQKGFHTDNEQHTREDGWGEITNYSLKSKEFKQRFVYNNMNIRPDGYHVPSGEEFGTMFPNNITSYSEKLLPINFVNYNTIQKGSVPYYDMYDPGDDDMRGFIVSGNDLDNKIRPYWESLHWGEKPLFYAYYMSNPNNQQEFYAIRFMGNNKEAKSASGHKIFGNRYRCVYRWRMLDMGSNVGDANDKGGVRVVIQSRWIGNANVSIRDITNEQWWGKCAPDNPLYNVDCYRVLPSTGFPHGYDSRWGLTYYSRTLWKYDFYSTDNVNGNITYCYRTYVKDGFVRGHNDNNQAYYGIRLICQRDQDEFGQNAPRQNQRDNSQVKLINRPADARVGKWEYIPPKK